MRLLSRVRSLVTLPRVAIVAAPAADEAPRIVPTVSGALPAEEVERITKDLIGVLKTVYDPEIPVDIYELGLIYKVDLDGNLLGWAQTSQGHGQNNCLIHELHCESETVLYKGDCSTWTVEKITIKGGGARAASTR